MYFPTSHCKSNAYYKINFCYRNGAIIIETDVFPATASDHSSQYVRVTLIVTLPVGYPDISPTIDLRNPRGLDDSLLQIMKKEIETKMENLVGEPVVFELIEVKCELILPFIKTLHMHL